MYISYESLIVGVVTFLLIIMLIRASKIRIKDAVFWIVWTITLSIFAFVPAVQNWIKELVGTSDPSLFLFILMVSFSYFVIFRDSAIISQHENKIKELSQNIAIQQLEQKKINREIMEIINKKK